MAREAAGELHATDPSRDAEFVIADGLSAETDSRMLRIVLTNLPGNAFGITQSGSAVGLVWRFRRDRVAAK